MEGSQCLNCVRSEIHNVLSTMRRNGRWASEERFIREIPSDYENPMIRSLKNLHDYLQPFDDINDVDAVAYLQPFLDVIAFPNTNGAMTGRALSSINKFLLYGAVTQESPRGREAINLAVASVVECKFEATNSYSDEVVLMQLLEVMVNLLRCPAGPFISDTGVWQMIETCYRLKAERGTSQLLRNTAANSLTHLILTLFSRASELITVKSVTNLEDRVLNFDGPPGGYFDSVLVSNNRARRQSEEGEVFKDDDFDDEDEDVKAEGLPPPLQITEENITHPQTKPSVDCPRGREELSPFSPTTSSTTLSSSVPPPPPLPSDMDDNDPDEVLYRMLQPIRFGNTGSTGSSTLQRTSSNTALTESYGLPVLVKSLEFLAQLTDPSQNHEADIVFALQLINIVLESAGEALATGSTFPKESSPVITVLQGDLCKHLLQNSQSVDLSVLSLTLRVIFNLFNAMKGHLKVQLEVFLTSVHLRIAESPTSTYEQKELALESLLDFCREPAMMLDLYTNYDCDFRCTNLFETLCKCLCRCSIPLSVFNDSTSFNSGGGISDLYDEDSTSISSEDFANNLDSILSLSSEIEESSSSTKDGGGVTVLQALALEGVLAVINAVARRCDFTDSNGDTTIDMKKYNLARVEELRNQRAGTPSPTAGQDWESGLDSDSSYSAKEVDGSTEEELLWLESARERKANMLRERKRMKRRLLLAAKQFNKQPTKQYWLDYAQDLGVLPTPVTPADVAKFFLNTPGLDKVAVGDYLAEEPERKPFNNEVMKAYIHSFNFKRVRIDKALRMLLESFRLPGEAQKVDRLMEAFGKHLYEQNKLGEGEEKQPNSKLKDEEAEVSVGIFKSADAAFIFAFSIIMLHTDLHNPGIAPNKKMKQEEFIKNNRNINEGENLPERLLVDVYQAIKREEMRMLYDPHASTSLTFEDVNNTGDNAQDNKKANPGGGGVSGAGPTWDTVLRHSRMVDKASFTPKSLGRLSFIRAGVHERDMYTILFDSSMQAISVMFEMTRDGKTAARALEGFRNLAKVAVYFSMTVQFNRIMITLCKYFVRFFPAVSEGGNQNEYDIEGLTALRDATVLSAAQAAKKQNHPSQKKRQAKLLASSLATAERFAAYPSCRALLTFRALLSLTKVYGGLMRESWRNFIQTLLAMHQVDFLPPTFVEIDDVVDSHGNRLPTSAVADSNRKSVDESEPVTQHRKGTNTNNSGGGGFFSTLTSFIWAEEDEVDEMYLTCKELVRETLSSCRLNTVFSKTSKTLNEESLVLLLDALLVPLEDASYSDTYYHEQYSSTEEIATSPFEKNTVLCVELLTEVGLANHERIALIWPILRRAYRQVLVNADAVPEGDDDVTELTGVVRITPPASPLKESLNGASCAAEKEENSSSIERKDSTTSVKKQIIKTRPNRVRKAAPCSMFVVERIVVSLLRISVHMLDNAAVLTSLLGALSWLGDFDDEVCERLASRIGSGLSTVLRFHAGNIRSALEWRVVCQLLDRFSHFGDSVDATWDIVQTIVQCGYVNRVNMNIIVETILVFIRMDERAALPPSAPPGGSSSTSSGKSVRDGRGKAQRWSAERAAAAVKLISDISRQVFTRDPDFCAEEETVTRRGNSADGEEELVKTHKGAYVVEESLLPDRHKCWIMLIIQIRCCFTDPRPEVAASATQCLQLALWSPPERIQPKDWLEIFQKVLFPLVEDSGRSSNANTMIRATTLLTRTFLHNVTVLADTAEFHLLWLQMITFMSRSLSRGEIVQESTLENLKNLIMVMQGEGLFEKVSHNAGENVWELTWNVIETQAPGVKSIIEDTLKTMKPDNGDATPAVGDEDDAMPVSEQGDQQQYPQQASPGFQVV